MLLVGGLAIGCSEEPSEDLCVGDSAGPSNGDVVSLTIDGVTETFEEADDSTCFGNYQLVEATSIRVFKSGVMGLLLQFPGSATANSTFDFSEPGSTFDVTESDLGGNGARWTAVAGQVTVIAAGGTEGQRVQGSFDGVVLEHEDDPQQTRNASGSFSVTHDGLP